MSDESHLAESRATAAADARTLSSPNTSAHELAIMSAVLNAMPASAYDEIAHYKDPAKCAAAYLPYLAWERGVDEWDHGWSDDVKRAVIAASPDVHAHAGTPHSIRLALESLGLGDGLEIDEQRGAEQVPCSFEVKTSINRLFGTGALTEETSALVERRIKKLKPVRSQYKFKLGLSLAPRETVAASVTAVAFAARALSAAPTVKRRRGAVAQVAFAQLAHQLRITLASTPTRPRE